MGSMSQHTCYQIKIGMVQRLYQNDLQHRCPLFQEVREFAFVSSAEFSKNE